MQVVSYADLKKCVAGAFGELQVAAQRAPAMASYAQGMLGPYARPPSLPY